VDDSREDGFAISTHSYPLQELLVVRQYLVFHFLVAAALSRACSSCPSLYSVVHPLAYFLYFPRFRIYDEQYRARFEALETFDREGTNDLPAKAAVVFPIR